MLLKGCVCIATLYVASATTILSTTSQSAVIIPIPITAAPATPVSSVDPTQTTISIETAANNDLIIRYPPKLQATLTNVINACNETDEDCANTVEATLLEGTPDLQKRVIAIDDAIAVVVAAGLIQLIASITLFNSGTGLGLARAAPPSVRLPASQASLVKSAIEASKPIEIAPQPTASSPVLWPINQGIKVDSQSNPDYIYFFVNDAAIYQNLHETSEVSGCGLSKLRRRDEVACLAQEAADALEQFIQPGHGHALESLIGMPRLPTISNPDLLGAIAQFQKLTSAFNGFSNLDLDIRNNIGGGLILMKRAADTHDLRNNLAKVSRLMLISSVPLSRKESEQGNTRTTQTSTSSTMFGTPYFVLPSSVINVDWVDRVLSQQLSPTPVRRHRFVTTTWDFWDMRISESQASLIQRVSNVSSLKAFRTISDALQNQLKVIRDEDQPKEAFFTKVPPPAAADPTIMPVNNQGDIPLLRQGYEPADEYDDLIDYSISPAAPPVQRARSLNDYVFPDLSKIDTVVYLIEEGVDTSHPDFGDKVWTAAPLVHPDLNWERHGKYGTDDNARGTCLASKLAGTRFGAAKNTMIIFVAIPLRISSFWWVFAAIHQDMVGRMANGIVKARRTVVVNSLSWNTDELLRKLNTDSDDNDYLLNVHDQIEQILMLDIPVIQGVKGLIMDPDALWTHHPTLPAKWAATLDIIRVGGVLPDGRIDAGPSPLYSRMDGQTPNDADQKLLFARSANVTCALPGGGRTMIKAGSSGAAAVAAAGTLLNAIVTLPDGEYDLGEPESLDIDEIIEGITLGWSAFEPTQRVQPYQLFSFQRLSMQESAPVAWNRLDGRKDACFRVQHAKRQAKNGTSECSLGVAASGTKTNSTATDRKTAMGTGKPSGSTPSTMTTQARNATSRPVFTTATSPLMISTSTITSVASLPSLSTLQIQCSSSRSGQTKIPQDYATKGIADYCTSSSRFYGQKTIDSTYFNTNYFVPRNDDSCRGSPVLLLGFGIFPDGAGAENYHGWPQEVCDSIMHGIASKCEWGGTQQIGFFEGSLNIAGINC